MAEYSTRNRSRLFKSGLVDTSDINDAAVTLDKLAPEVVAEYAAKTYVDTAVSNLIDSAPGVLDTLNELAAAINDDANFFTTVNNSIATKLSSADFDSTFDTRLATKTTDDLTEGTNLYFTDARVQTKLANVSGHIIPDSDITYDLGSATNRFRDLYLSGNTIKLGGASISATGDGKVAFTGVVAQELTLGENTISLDEATGKIVLPADAQLGDAKLPPVDLEILPEVLGIQVAATTPGDDIVWNWTWLQSTLPYARATITNSPQLSVPLYKKGTYTLDNFIAYETFGDLTQTHPAYLKWIDGAGTDNLVSWATYVQTTSSHPDINDGLPTLVQRYTILVPEELILPTLTLPQGIGYGVSFDTAGSYTFGADMMDHAPMQGSIMHSVAEGRNPNIGPMYRGATYTFYLDPTVENHPFYLTTDNGQGFVPGQYVGEYTSGVTGSRNNGTTGKETITFTVPMDAPDILYYQCGNHQSMRGVITIRDLAVEQNANGNYVLYFQHTHEGHKTPIEIRPIPSLVNQMCLVYSAAAGKFVPQDLSTYIENTPSFKAKIQEIAGTATLIDASGQPIVATVKIFSDPGYLPFAGNKAGDIAYTEDTNTVFIWDETQYNWKSTKARNTDEVGEGSGNLYFTEDRVQTKLGKVSGHILPDTNLAYALGSPTKRFSEVYLSSNSVYLDEFSLSIDTGTFVVTDPDGNPTPLDLAANSTSDLAEGSNLFYTDARVRAVLTADSIANTSYVDTAISNLVESAPATLDTLNELAAALGDDPNFATTVATNIGTRADSSITISAGTGLTGGGDLTANRSFALATSGVTAGSYGSASTVPVITVDAYGRVTSATTTNVAGVSGFSYTAATNTYTITTSAGTSFDATGDLTSFDTDDLTEGTNQYFTIARARASISATGSLSYNSTTGVISYTAPTTVSAFTNDAGYITSSSSISGNAATATKLATARTIALSGDVTGSISFDGSANATIAATIAANSVALGTDTTGNYVSGLTAGTGITISGVAGEGWSPTVTVDSTIATKAYADAAASAVQTAILGGAGAAYDTLQEIKTLMDSADASLQTAINNLTIGNGTMTVTAGSGMTGGGSFTANQTGNTSVTLSHADTSSVANVNAATNSFISGITFDTYGHVQTVTTGAPSGFASSTHYHDRIYNGASGTSSYLALSSTNELEYYNSSGVIDILYLQYSGTPAQLKGPGGAQIWMSSNDGSGSGLDADTLDGLHATSFSRYYEQTTPPTANNGDEWYDTADGILYKKVTGVWVQQQPSSGIAIFDVNGSKVN